MAIEKQPEKPKPFRWQAFLMVLRQAMLMLVTWIEEECDLKRKDK